MTNPLPCVWVKLAAVEVADMGRSTLARAIESLCMRLRIPGY